MLSSCMLSFDDIKPTDKVPGDEVWNDEAAIIGIMANMYNSLIFEDFVPVESGRISASGTGR